MAKRSKSRRPPTDPAEIARQAYEARRDPTKWGPNEKALALPANGDVSDVEATRLKVRRIQRYDCFELLHIRRTLAESALTAVRRLQDDIALLHATSGQRRGGSGPADVDGFSAARCDAGSRITEVLDGDGRTGGVSTMNRALLTQLSEPEIVGGQRVNWRAIVQRITGDCRKAFHGDYVANACDALAGSYLALDNRPRQRAA